MDKACGDDGCGGSCGPCEEGFVCAKGKCVTDSGGREADGDAETEGDAEATEDSSQDDVGGPETSSEPLPNGECEAGMVLMYGKCVPIADGLDKNSAASTGCGMGGTSRGQSPLLLLVLLMATLVAVRRQA